MTLRIAVALFDDAEELDWAGPWEELASWAGARRAPGHAVRPQPAGVIATTDHD